MNNTLTKQLLAPAVTRRFAHCLHSSSARSKGVLMITGYDYFLHKGDYRRLLKRYREIILVPRSADSDHLLNYILRPLLARHNKLHLVCNPFYDDQHRVVYELVVRQSKSIRVSTTADFCERDLGKLYIPQIMEEAIINQSLPGFAPWVNVMKRSLDVVTAAGLLLTSLPFWLMSALQIKQESPGPVFYQQSRVGIQNKEFHCIKFRSMRLDAEAAGAQFSRRGDQRVFRYGALMRSIRLDELPQLINVLKGEMSLVGPRPERQVFTDSFEEVIPHYAERHTVKPGITGYAQVRYPYGVGTHDARHKLMYDLYYIRNWSVALEMRVLLETVRVILTKKGW